MVGRGWSHEVLMAMAEFDFAFWLAEQVDYDKAVADARARAAKAAQR